MFFSSWLVKVEQEIKNFSEYVKSVGIHSRFYIEGVVRQKLRKPKGWQKCRARNLCAGDIN